MRKITILIIMTLMLGLTNNVYSDEWTESFEDQTSGSYISSFTCNISGTWTASEAGNFGLGDARTGSKCLAINDDKSNAHATTPSLNTCGTVNFWYYQRSGNSSDEFNLQVSEDGGAFSTVATQSFNVGTTYTEFTYDVNSSSNSVKIRLLSNDNSGHLIIDDFSVTNYSGTNPTITLSETALTGFNYTVGNGPSTEQTFTAEGNNLTANISIAAPTNYEISTGTGGNFVATNPITLTQSGGSVASTTIYVRLKTSLVVGDYNSENITATSTGATSKTVTCNGSVSMAPITSFPWNEDFESGTFVPTGWAHHQTDYIGNGWTESTAQSNSSSHSAVHLYNAGGNCNNWLISPAFDLSSVNSPKLAYWEYVKYASYADQHNVMYSIDYDGSNDPSTSTWTNISTTIGTEEWVEKSDFDLPENNSVYIAFQYVGDDASDWFIDDISITETAAVPTVTLSETTLLDFTYAKGSGPSDEQTFTAEGSYLTADISITAPTNYEISTGTGGSFSATSPITLTQSGGSVAETTIYVRLKAGLDVGDYNSENISATSTGATSQTVACSGSVTCPVLAAPVAADASNIDVENSSFSANWATVSGADGYELDVYYEEGSEITEILNEPFDDGISPFPTGWYKSAKVYDYTSGNPGNAIKLGSSSNVGYITTPTVDCSTGDFTIKLDAKEYSSSENKITISHASDGTNFGSDIDIDLTSSWVTYSYDFSGGTSNSKIKISTYSSSQERAYIDNVIVSAGGSTTTHILQNEDIGNVTTYSVTGIEDMSKEYKYVVRATNDCGNTSDNSNEISMLDYLPETVDGATTWNSTASWDIDPAAVPNSSHNAVVRHPIIIPYNYYAEAKNIWIVGDGSITLESQTLGTAALLATGKVFGDITVQRYLSPNLYHYFSSPVATSAMVAADFGINKDNDFDALFSWDETDVDGAGLWVDELHIEGDISLTPAAATGYAYCAGGDAIGSGTAKTVSFTGAVRNDVDFTATYTNPGGHGYHIVGNPFPCPIAVKGASDAFITDNTSVLTADAQGIYVWVEQASYVGKRDDYQIICNTGFSGSTLINQNNVAVGQAFMIRVKSGGGDIVFNKDTQSATATPFYKSEGNWPGIQLFATSENVETSTIIGFNDEMSSELDPSYDVASLMANTGANIYTNITGNENAFGVQALPATASSVSCGMQVIEAGEYTFSIYQEMMQEVFLEDIETGVITDLLASEYTVDLTEDDYSDRFLLHFKSTNGVEESEISSDFEIYSFSSNLYIENPNRLNATVVVYNALGQEMQKMQINGDEKNNFYLNIEAGYYVVKVISNESISTKKVYLN